MFRGTGVLVGVLLLGTICSCDRGPATDNISKDLEANYQAYLTGDRVSAKQSLVKSIELIASARMRPFNRAQSFYLHYMRLYAFEARGGDPIVAEAYLIKSKYWFLKKIEQSGTQEDWPIDGPSTRVGAEDAAQLDGAKIIEIVDKWDMGANSGRRARYAEPQS